MPRERQSLAYVLCVEAGPLERQALALAESIRRWAGGYADSPIHAFRLREGPRLAGDTYAGLAELGVELHEEVLNRDHHDYVHVNTTYALAWAEEHLDAEVLVWSDSDMVFLGDPEGFDLPEGVVGAGTGPYYVGRKRGPKSTGPGHPFDPYWQRMYELAGVESEPWMTTLIEGERVRAFFNGGLIVMRRSAGLAREWLELFELLLAAGHVPGYGILNVDQLSLAALFARRPDRVLQLDHRYNHNIGIRERLPEPQRSWELDELVSVHYHTWFRDPAFLERVEPPLRRDSERFEWLAARLPL